MAELTGEFSPQQIERYSRHILLPDIGGRGQRRLLEATVRVRVGAGCDAEACALPYLAAAGIGRLVLWGSPDGPVTVDDVSRGIVYGASDIGRARGDAIAERLAALNPDTTVEVEAAPPSAEARALPCLAVDEVPGGDDCVADALLRGSRAAAQLIGRIGRG